MALILVRHGERYDYIDPSWVSKAPRPWDPPLTSKGKLMSYLCGQRINKHLKEMNLPGIRNVYTSPLLRCVETSVGVIAGYFNSQETQIQKSDELLKSLFKSEYSLTEFQSICMEWFYAWAIPGADGEWGGPKGGLKAKLREVCKKGLLRYESRQNAGELFLNGKEFMQKVMKRGMKYSLKEKTVTNLKTSDSDNDNVIQTKSIQPIPHKIEPKIEQNILDSWTEELQKDSNESQSQSDDNKIQNANFKTFLSKQEIDKYHFIRETQTENNSESTLEDPVIESESDTANRLGKFLDYVYEKHCSVRDSNSDKSESVLLCSHGGPCMLTHGYLISQTIDGTGKYSPESMKDPLPSVGYTSIQIYVKKSKDEINLEADLGGKCCPWKCLLFGDMEHLKGIDEKMKEIMEKNDIQIGVGNGQSVANGFHQIVNFDNDCTSKVTVTVGHKVSELNEELNSITSMSSKL